MNKKINISEKELRKYIESDLRRHMTNESVSAGISIKQLSKIEVGECKIEIPSELKAFFDELREGEIEKIKQDLYNRAAMSGLDLSDATSIAANRAGQRDFFGRRKKVKVRFPDGTEGEVFLPADMNERNLRDKVTAKWENIKATIDNFLYFSNLYTTAIGVPSIMCTMLVKALKYFGQIAGYLYEPQQAQDIQRLAQQQFPDRFNSSSTANVFSIEKPIDEGATAMFLVYKNDHGLEKQDIDKAYPNAAVASDKKESKLSSFLMFPKFTKIYVEKYKADPSTIQSHCSVYDAEFDKDCKAIEDVMDDIKSYNYVGKSPDRVYKDIMNIIKKVHDTIPIKENLKALAKNDTSEIVHDVMKNEYYDVAKEASDFIDAYTRTISASPLKGVGCNFSSRITTFQSNIRL